MEKSRLITEVILLNRIKTYRFLRNKTQDDLMVQTRIDQSRISRIERGVLKPTDEEKQKLAKALKTTAEKLFRNN